MQQLRKAHNEPNVLSDVDSHGTYEDLNTGQNVAGVSSSEHSTVDEAILSGDESHKQLIPYDPSVSSAGPIAAVPLSSRPLESHTQRYTLSVDTYTVQCANCLKWRLIPEEKKYEEIREHLTNRPFVCKTASEWRPGVSCDDPPDIEQDGSRLWAIDKPDIAQPPPRWKRLLKIRKKGSTKFADVYYTEPSGTKLRSMPEVKKFLDKHTEYVLQGVTLARFSFQSPRPLEEDYLRKRPARTQTFHDGTDTRMPESHEPSPADHPRARASPETNVDLQIVEPIAWARPEENVHRQPGMPAPKKVKSAPR